MLGGKRAALASELNEFMVLFKVTLYLKSPCEAVGSWWQEGMELMFEVAGIYDAHFRSVFLCLRREGGRQTVFLWPD